MEEKEKMSLSFLDFSFQGAEEPELPSASDVGAEHADRIALPGSVSPVAAAPTAAADNATQASLRMVSFIAIVLLYQIAG